MAKKKSFFDNIECTITKQIEFGPQTNRKKMIIKVRELAYEQRHKNDTIISEMLAGTDVDGKKLKELLPQTNTTLLDENGDDITDDFTESLETLPINVVMNVFNGWLEGFLDANSFFLQKLQQLANQKDKLEELGEAKSAKVTNSSTTTENVPDSLSMDIEKKK